MSVIKIIKSNVDKLPHPVKGQKLYFDTEVKGFGICVGSGTKTYFVQGLIGKKLMRIKIGRHGVFTPEQARSEAKEKLVDTVGRTGDDLGTKDDGQGDLF